MLEHSDEDLIYLALHQWANYIETGDINMSAQDAHNQDRKFNALSTKQMKFVVRLRELGNTIKGVDPDTNYDEDTIPF